LRNLIFFVLFLAFNHLYSQDHSQFWLRTSIQYNLDKNWSSTLELHHRTQSLANTESPFRYPLTNAVRLWISYKLNSNHTLIVSPYAFFSNDPVVNNVGDELRLNVNEHRTQVQYENKISVSRLWLLTSRFGAEYRIFERNQDLFRFRIREGLNYIVSKNLSLQIYDELFLNTINIERSHVFDQNRIGFQLSYALDRHIKLDLGHNLIHALPRNGELVPTSFMFFTTFYYTI
jgi:hypothetical protein